MVRILYVESRERLLKKTKSTVSSEEAILATSGHFGFEYHCWRRRRHLAARPWHNFPFCLDACLQLFLKFNNEQRINLVTLFVVRIKLWLLDAKQKKGIGRFHSSKKFAWKATQLEKVYFPKKTKNCFKIEFTNRFKDNKTNARDTGVLFFRFTLLDLNLGGPPFF